MRISAVIYGVVAVATLVFGIYSIARADYLLGALSLIVSLATSVLIVLTVRQGKRG